MNKLIYWKDCVGSHQFFMKPASLAEREKIAYKLMCQKWVYVDFSRLNTDAERKILYFLSGVAYGLNGSVTQISSSKYIFKPL